MQGLSIGEPSDNLARPPRTLSMPRTPFEPLALLRRPFDCTVEAFAGRLPSASESYNCSSFPSTKVLEWRTYLALASTGEGTTLLIRSLSQAHDLRDIRSCRSLNSDLAASVTPNSLNERNCSSLRLLAVVILSLALESRSCLIVSPLPHLRSGAAESRWVSLRLHVKQFPGLGLAVQNRILCPSAAPRRSPHPTDASFSLCVSKPPPPHAKPGFARSPQL
jgi:hypothetical protein